MPRYRLGKVFLLCTESAITEQIGRIVHGCSTEKLIPSTNLKEAPALLGTCSELQLALVYSKAPHTEALALAQYIRAHVQQSTFKVPIVIICDALSRSDYQAIQKLGFDHIVQKPLNDSILENTMTQLVLTSSFKPTKEILLEQIEEAILQGNPSEIESMVQTVLQKNPNSVEFLTLAARHYLTSGNIAKAEKTIAQAIAANPNFTPAIHIALKVFIQSDQAIKALHLINKSKKAEEGQSFAHRFETADHLAALLNNQGMSLANHDQPKEAIAFYRYALEMDISNENHKLIQTNLNIAKKRLQRTSDPINSKPIQKTKEVSKVAELLVTLIPIEEKPIVLPPIDLGFAIELPPQDLGLEIELKYDSIQEKKDKERLSFIMFEV